MNEWTVGKAVESLSVDLCICIILGKFTLKIKEKVDRKKNCKLFYDVSKFRFPYGSFGL